MKQNNHFENEKRVNFDFKFSNEIEIKIANWKKEKIFFGIFPVTGESMTCKDALKSIPNNSKILVYDIEINFNNGLNNVWHQIPKDKPLMILGKTNTGKTFNVCKTVSSIDAVNGLILLSSHNPTHKCNWIPFEWITSIFKVVQIV